MSIFDDFSTLQQELPFWSSMHRLRVKLICFILWKERGKVVTRFQLMNSIYGTRKHPDTRIVDVLVTEIRAKLSSTPGWELASIHGKGWVLLPPTETNTSAEKKTFSVEMNS